MTVFGAPKVGKSHFALTAPGPIIYFSLEPGLEGVVEKFMETKEVFIAGTPDKNGYPTYAFASAGKIKIPP